MKSKKVNPYRVENDKWLKKRARFVVSPSLAFKFHCRQTSKEVIYGIPLSQAREEAFDEVFFENPPRGRAKV